MDLIIYKVCPFLPTLSDKRGWNKSQVFVKWNEDVSLPFFLFCFCLFDFSRKIHGTGIFTYIYQKNQPNVGKYTRHGSHKFGGKGFEPGVFTVAFGRRPKEALTRLREAFLWKMVGTSRACKWNRAGAHLPQFHPTQGNKTSMRPY